MEIEELKAERDEALKQVIALAAKNETLEREVAQLKRNLEEWEEKWARVSFAFGRRSVVKSSR
jgi:FtsZ-binding cell division protein ZapB